MGFGLNQHFCVEDLSLGHTARADLRKHQEPSGFLHEFHPYTEMLEEISVPKGFSLLYLI